MTADVSVALAGVTEGNHGESRRELTDYGSRYGPALRRAC